MFPEVSTDEVIIKMWESAQVYSRWEYPTQVDSMVNPITFILLNATYCWTRNFGRREIKVEMMPLIYIYTLYHVYTPLSTGAISYFPGVVEKERLIVMCIKNILWTWWLTAQCLERNALVQVLIDFGLPFQISTWAVGSFAHLKVYRWVKIKRGARGWCLEAHIILKSRGSWDCPLASLFTLCTQALCNFTLSRIPAELDAQSFRSKTSKSLKLEVVTFALLT